MPALTKSDSIIFGTWRSWLMMARMSLGREQRHTAPERMYVESIHIKPKVYICSKAATPSGIAIASFSWHSPKVTFNLHIYAGDRKRVHVSH